MTPRRFHGPIPIEAQAAFRDAFGPPATHLAWAPGRVNLIGDHIDYHDLAVLPMALERGVRVLFRPTTGTGVRVVNIDPAFPGVAFEASPSPARAAPGDWGNYLRAAVASIHRWAERSRQDPSPDERSSHKPSADEPLSEGRSREKLRSARGAPDAAEGFEALVFSDLPVAAGLSSSSALLVAMAQVALESMRARIDPGRLGRTEMAALLAEGERYVGTAGGGMDQAASIGGLTGHALRVEFDPVRWQSAPLPDSWAVVVAHSGVRAEKSGSAQQAYNELRRRGEAALERVARATGVAASYSAIRSRPAAEVTSAAGRVLDRPQHAVFDHVMREAARVDEGWQAIGAGDGVRFGQIMDRSHTSLTDDCGVGHPALDELVGVARRAGAWGARLTGAGFGGSIVALVDTARTAPVLAALREAASARGYDPTTAPVFRARAGQGAGVVALG